MTLPDKTSEEGKPEEFQYAIQYSIEGIKDCSVRWAPNSTVALDNFAEEIGEYLLHDIHKI